MRTAIWVAFTTGRPRPLFFLVSVIDLPMNYSYQQNRPEGSSNFHPGPNRHRSVEIDMATKKSSEIPAGNQTAWDSMMEMFLSAEAKAEEFRKEHHEPMQAQLTQIWPGYNFSSVADREAYDRWAEHSGFHAIDEKLEKLSEAVCAWENALMAYPSPSAEALQWKLDKILEPDLPSSTTPCWNADFVQQTVEDYRHFLGSAAQTAKGEAA